MNHLTKGRRTSRLRTIKWSTLLLFGGDFVTSDDDDDCCLSIATITVYLL